MSTLTVVVGDPVVAVTVPVNTIAVSVSGAPGPGVTVQDEGTALAAQSTLNFIGTGVTVTDDAANSRTNVTIAGGGEGGGVTDHAALTGRSTADQHPISAITSLQTSLNGKAATAHTHVATTDLTATGTKDTTTFLRGDNTWAVPAGGGGTAVAAGVALIVASATASAKVKAGADYVCDGTADNVEIQAAIDAVRVAGGVVQLSTGNFAIAATVNLLGNDTGASASLHTIDLRGSGAQATTFNVANNVNGIEIGHWAQVNISDLGIYIQGSGIGIHSTAVTTSDTRSFWHSTFRNIRITGAYATAATGWAMWLDMPWRSVFENIEVEGTRNGIKIVNNSTVQNAGDCTFTRMFVEIAGDNGYALNIESISNNMNQNNWSMFEANASSTSVGTTGIYLGGAYYGGTASQRFWGLNLEQFQTCINVASGESNVFDCNYVTGNDGDPLNKMFVCGAGSWGNTFSAKYVNVNSSETLKLIEDASTSTKHPNVFERIRIENNPGASVTYAKTAYTIIRDIVSIDTGTAQAGLLGINQSQGTVVGPASTTTIASARLPHGAAPTAPVDGDMWTTSAGLFVRINGVTKTVTLT